ncbi:chromosome assembly [Cryptosporidium bovis]|uniref:chromosome assembly n=1 Tax=Cryptosporidium bovis TaxID=310047 RepID=UPI00351A327F|nr:chromosome assembly [Cryptosporidium bovis]
MMFSQKENLNSNLNSGKFNNSSVPFSITINELTEKAAKVRSLLERRQRNDAIKELISVSRGELMSINNIKSEIMSEHRESLEKIIGIVEKKVDDYLIKNEAFIKLNIDQCIEKNNEVVNKNLENFLKRVISSIDSINTSNDKLCLTIEEQKSSVENHFTELNKSIDDKNDYINNIIKIELRNRNEKENGLYLSQLRVIQKQYELIIRDLRKKNAVLENEIESKLIYEKELEENIKLINIKVGELSNLINEKNVEISTLSSKLDKLRDENTNLTEDIRRLKIRNDGMINIFREQIELSKKRYISFGKGIYSLEFVLNNIRYRQIETAFTDIRDYSNVLNSTKPTDQAKSHNKMEPLHRLIDESNLYSLIKVEKEIKEQEKEQNMINRLLDFIGEDNFFQLISFVSIISKKNNEVLRIAFLNLKFNS